MSIAMRWFLLGLVLVTVFGILRGLVAGFILMGLVG